MRIRNNKRKNSKINLLKCTSTGELGWYLFRLEFNLKDNVYSFELNFKDGEWGFANTIVCKFLIEDKISIIDIDVTNWLEGGRLGFSSSTKGSSKYFKVSKKFIQLFKEESKELPKLHRSIVLYVLKKYEEKVPAHKYEIGFIDET